MTERELLRTALVIPPRGRAVLCVWAGVPGLVCAPFVFWQSIAAGCVFCAVWTALVFEVWVRSCSFAAWLTPKDLVMQAGVAVPAARQLPRQAVTGLFALRTPLLWMAGCSVLVVRCPGAQLILPGVPGRQAQALTAALTEDAP